MVLSMPTAARSSGSVRDRVAGDLERFTNRTVNFADRHGDQRVRIVSKIVWVAEDGGSLGWAKHTYGKYGLAMSSGLIPSFGQESATRNGSARRAHMAGVATPSSGAGRQARVCAG